MHTEKMTPMGYQALAPTAATKLTVPKGARSALFSIEVQAVRFTDDGTVPELTVGLLLQTTDSPLHYHGNLHGVQFMNAVAGGLVKVLYYG